MSKTDLQNVLPTMEGTDEDTITDVDSDAYLDENLVETHWIPLTVDNKKIDSHVINCTASD